MFIADCIFVVLVGNYRFEICFFESEFCRCVCDIGTKDQVLNVCDMINELITLYKKKGFKMSGINCLQSS